MAVAKHPPGLYVLFFTEMWERFSFYCMNAIFVLYMKDSGYPFLEKHWADIAAFYLGFVYFTPFFGGMIADRAWGYRKTILVGASIMGIGQFLLATDGLPYFFGGLIALVIGNGLFKPNISSLVGKLYPPGDPRLDNAFTIFYMGINVGAFASPLVAQYLHKEFGYHTAFAAAGVGMCLSMVIFEVFQRWIIIREDQPLGFIPTGTVAAVSPEVQRERHMVLLIVFAIVVLFWMAFKQNSVTLPLWAKTNTDRMPAEWLSLTLDKLGLAWFFLDKEGAFSPALFASVNPFFVIVFSPLLVWFWGRLRSRGLEPSTPAKVGFGMALTAMAFSIFAIGAISGGNTGAVSAWYLLDAYALLTLGELMLSPMGLSLVSKLAAPGQRSTWMGGWFVATALGSYLAGFVGRFWEKWQHSTFFAFLVATSLCAGVLLLFAYRRIYSAMPAQTKEPAAPIIQPAEPDSTTS